MLTVAGDQLTGKSTLAKLIAHSAMIIDSKISSYGQQVKFYATIAAERNQSIGEFSNSTMDGTSTDCQHIDISIDYRTCNHYDNVKGLMPGKANHEAMDLFMIGRQPAVMATFCQF